MSYHLFRVGDGEEMIFEIRKTYTESGEVVAYLPEPLVPRAKTIHDLRKILEHMMACLEQTPMRPDRIIELPQEPWGKH